jgi:hypothetical protein
MDKERIAASGLSYALYANDPSVSAPASFINTGGVDQSAPGTAPLKLYTWTFLASTYDGTTLKMYVNGVLVGSTPVSANILETKDPLHIGGDAVWGEWFQGRIDNVRIYNQALRQSEIRTDMNTPVGSATPATAIRSSVQGSSVFVGPGRRSSLLAQMPSQDVAALVSNQSEMVLLSYVNGSTAPRRIDNPRGTIEKDGSPSVDQSRTIQAIVRLFSRLDGTGSLANRLNGQGSPTAPRSTESASLEQLFTLNGRERQETTVGLGFWLD